MYVEMIPCLEQKHFFHARKRSSDAYSIIPLKLLLRNQTCNWLKKWMHATTRNDPFDSGFLVSLQSEFPTKLAVRSLIRIHYAGTSSLSDLENKEIYMYIIYCNFDVVISNSNWLSTKMVLKMLIHVKILKFPYLNHLWTVKLFVVSKMK